MASRLTIGLVEDITFSNNRTYKAKIDTGADSCSVDSKLLSKIGEGEEGSYKLIKSSLGEAKRPTVYLQVSFHGTIIRERFSVADRGHLRYKVLIGKTLLKKKKVLIDPCLKSSSPTRTRKGGKLK